MAFKVIVIGTGFGRYAMAPGFQALGCDVELVSPRDSAAIAALLDGGCDLVSIHSPPFLHLEHVRMAVERKLPVLCDKPFGRNAAEAREMVDLATGAGVLHYLNFEFRHDPLRMKIRELIEAGAIGEPQHFNCTMFSSMGRDRPYGWLYDRQAGGGWLGAYASHHVDLLHWLFGEIEEVSCQTRIDVRTRPDGPGGEPREVTAEDAVLAWFRMKNGVTSSLDTAMAGAADFPMQMTLLGSEGALQSTFGAGLVLQRPDEEPQQFSGGDPNDPVGPALGVWLAEVLESVRTGQPIIPDFNTGLQCALVLDAMCDRSAR